MSFWSFITGTTPQEEQQANLDRQKAQYEAALARRQAAGTISADQAAADQAYVSGVTLDDTDAAAAQGFKEGLQEGLQNVLAAPGKVAGFAGNTAGQLVWGILKNIPWWVYVGGAVFLFFWLGGLPLLLGALAKRRLSK